MKNIIKKITAAAMAFTLLGAGTAAIKTVAPQTDNTLVADAGVPVVQCSHVGKGTYYTYSNWWYNPVSTTVWNDHLGWVTISIDRWMRYKYVHCSGCKCVTASVAEYKY